MTCTHKHTYSVGDDALLRLTLMTDKDTEHKLESIKDIKAEIYYDKDMTALADEVTAIKKGYSSNAYISIPSSVKDTAGTYYLRIKAVLMDDTEETLDMLNNTIIYQ